MRMAGRLKTKTVHGVRTGNHSNPHVLKAAKAYSGEAGGTVDGEDARRSFSETPRMRRADGGSVVGKLADGMADLAMPGRAMGRAVQGMTERFARKANERTAEETRATMPEGPARFGASMGEALRRADGGGVKISEDSKAKAAALRKSADSDEGMARMHTGLGAVNSAGAVALAKRSPGLGLANGVGAMWNAKQGFNSLNARDAKQAEAKSIERGEAVPGREDGDKVARKRGGGLPMLKGSLKGKAAQAAAVAIKAKDPLEMSKPEGVLPAPKDGELPMPGRKRGGGIRNLMRARKGEAPEMEPDDEDDDDE